MNESLQALPALPALMEMNIYALRGNVLVAGTCLPRVWPNAFARLAADADQVYTLCLETTHINMAVTKLAAALGTGQVRRLTFASVDRSPHCTQLHYIRHEIERTLPDHVPMAHFVVSGGEIVAVSDGAIELSKSLAELTGRLNGQEGR